MFYSAASKRLIEFKVFRLGDDNVNLFHITAIIGLDNLYVQYLTKVF